MPEPITRCSGIPLILQNTYVSTSTGLLTIMYRALRGVFGDLAGDLFFITFTLF